MTLRGLGAVVVLMLAARGEALEGQLVVGERVRVIVREEQRQDEDATRRRLVLRGDLTRVSGDTLFLRPAGTVGELGIPMSSAQRLYRSEGVRSRAVSVIRNAVILGGLGVLYGGLLHNPRDDDPFEGRGKAYLYGAAVGAATGIVWGALFPTERWQRVR